MLPSLYLPFFRTKDLFPRILQRWPIFVFYDHYEITDFNIFDVFQSIAVIILIDPQIVVPSLFKLFIRGLPQECLIVLSLSDVTKYSRPGMVCGV